VNIALVPPSDQLRNNRLLDVNSFDIESNLWVRLIQDKGYSIYTIDIFDFKNNLPDIIIFLGLDWLVMYYAYKNNVPSIYIAAESPIIEINHQASELVKLTNFFSLIFTWDGSLIGHQSGKFRNFYYSFRKNRGLILQDKK